MFLTEEEVFEEGVYQLETTDPVQGGPNGIDNLQAKQLANRTQWLKAAILAIQGASFVAAKALKLSVARKINGVEFDGSVDIVITAAPTAHTHNYQPVGDYQEHNTKLDALAALTLAANKLIYANGSDTFSTTTLSAFARTLLDDSDGASVFTTMGATQSFGTSGYTKLPNGFIEQWGVIPTGTAVAQTVTLPIAFSAGVYGIFSNFIATTTATTDDFSAVPAIISNSQISVMRNAYYAVYWRVIGK